MEWLDIVASVLSVSALTAVGGMILKLRRQSHFQRLQARAVETEDEREDHRTALTEYKGLFQTLRRQLAAMETDIEELRTENLRCREEAAEMRGKISLLEYRLSLVVPKVEGAG